MLAPDGAEVQGFSPDFLITELTGLARDALRAHLRQSLDRMLAAGWEGDAAVDSWRGYWGDVLDSIVADVER